MNWALEQRSEGFQGASCWGIYRPEGRCPGGKLVPIGGAVEEGMATVLSSERAYFHWGTKESIMEQEGRLWLGPVTGYLEPCGHLLAGLWETTRQGRVGSDIIRFAIFKGHSACWMERWAGRARKFMKKPTPWVREPPMCGCGQVQSHSPQLPDQNILGTSVQARSLRRWQYVVGTWDSDVKQLTEMRYHDGSRDDTWHRSQLTLLCQAGHWDCWPLLFCLSSTHRSLDRQTVLQQRSVTSGATLLWLLWQLLPSHPILDGDHTCRVYSLAASCRPTWFPSCPGLCIERKQTAQEFAGITPASGFQFQNMPTLCSPWILLPCWPGSSPVNHPYLCWKDRLRLLLLRLSVSLMLAVWLFYWVEPLSVLLNFLFPGLAYKTHLINMLAHIQNIQTEKNWNLKEIQFVVLFKCI